MGTGDVTAIGEGRTCGMKWGKWGRKCGARNVGTWRRNGSSHAGPYPGFRSPKGVGNQDERIYIWRISLYSCL
jgi:hypothetical protein